MCLYVVIDVNALVDRAEICLEKLLVIAKDPEHFLVNKYYRLAPPKGFRIDLFAARKFTSVRKGIEEFKFTCRNPENQWLKWKWTGRMISNKKLRERHLLSKDPKKIFCPYCENLVVPKRIHKLDLADIMLFLFTGGFWAILLFFIYLFVRRCPVCNYNLRRFKPLRQKKTR